MLLRNGKIIGKDITISCVEKLPYEILVIIIIVKFALEIKINIVIIVMNVISMNCI